MRKKMKKLPPKEITKPIVSILPCNGCTLCCRGDAIFLHPELGDDETQYETTEYQNRKILAHKPNNDCYYLDRQKGCTIWERRPAICKELDCRIWLSFSKRKKFELINSGMLTKEHLKKAKQMRAKMRFNNNSP